MRARLQWFASGYADAIASNPIRTKLATNFTLGCIGDFLCQQVMRNRLKDDKEAL